MNAHSRRPALVPQSRIAGAGLVALALAVAACDSPTPPQAPATDQTVLARSHGSHGGHGAGAGAVRIDGDLLRQVNELRAAMGRFHQVEHAERAGYARITECMAEPGVGGMGLHYGKTPFDAELDHTSPEILVYAPAGKSGKNLRLVAVEWAVPYALVPRESAPPTVMGIPLHHNDLFQLWVLHAWAWENNPAGMFEDWNPRIAC